MPRSMIDIAITALLVLYLALLAIFLVLVVTGNISPAGAAGLGLTVTGIVCIWHWLRYKRKTLQEKARALQRTA